MTELYKLEYEAKQRLKWFIDGYFIHCLGSLFSKISTEDLCKWYNVELTYFRPWLNEGLYSEIEMIRFAKYAKNYTSPKTVEEAFKKFKKCK